MDKQQLLRLVSSNIIKKRNVILSDNEMQYITNQINKLSSSFINTHNISDLVHPLTDLFLNDFKQLKIKSEPTEIDVHEMLKYEIGTLPETINTTLSLIDSKSNSMSNCRSNTNAKLDISSILGNTAPIMIQRIFNPIALEKKAYVVLDRRYQSGQNADNIHYFSWDISPGVSSIASVGTLSTSAPLKDIVKIKMFPFTFPNTPGAITDTNRITIGISEFSSQSYSATTGAIITTGAGGHTSLSATSSRQFHFEFKVVPNPNNPLGPYTVEDVGQSAAEFEFYKPIEQLTTITISFGNPFLLLALESDRGIASIMPNGIQTQLTFTIPPFLAIGDIIYISGFNTTNESADAATITLVNNPYGWAVVTIPTSTQVLLDLDLSDLVGIIIGDVNCYFDSKRFAPRLEFTFIRT